MIRPQAERDESQAREALATLDRRRHCLGRTQHHFHLSRGHDEVLQLQEVIVPQRTQSYGNNEQHSSYMPLSSACLLALKTISMPRIHLETRKEQPVQRNDVV